MSWAKSISGNSDKFAFSITLDNSNGVYIAGGFNDTIDADPGSGVVELYSNGNRDFFIEKLNSNGDFEWVKSIGGNEFDLAAAVLVDDKDIYAVGTFGDTVDFDPGTGIFYLISEEARNGNITRDGFIMKLQDKTSVIDGFVKNKTTYMNAYPNPTYGILNIASSSKIKSIEIMDITGKTLSIDHKNTLDISSFKKGYTFENKYQQRSSYKENNKRVNIITNQYK